MATLTKTSSKGANSTPPASPFEQDVLETLKILEEFGDLLKQETTALKKNDFEVVDSLQAQKKSLATKYQALVFGLAERKVEMAKLNLTLRERLVKARTEFTTILSANMRMLESVKESSRRLADRILEVARKSVVDTNQTHYTAKAHPRACKTASMSMNVDQKF